MVRAKLIGIKKVDGVGKNGPYAFSIACLTSEMADFDLRKGAKGENVHAVTVPDRCTHVLNEANIGKEVNCDFYFNNGRENVAYAELFVPGK